jgi:hypothetical protein
MCKGEERTGIQFRVQNVGTENWQVDHAAFAGFCSGITNPQMAVAYHLYRTDGTPACANCIGLRSTPLCHPDQVLVPGIDQLSWGFEIFIPDDPAIIEGNTYWLRFDIMDNGVWQGHNAGFPWPPQDVPVQICTSSGGGPDDEPVVDVDYPPAVVTYGDLVDGEYGFSWSSPNAHTYDLDYCTKEIWQAGCDSEEDFIALYQNIYAQQVSQPVECYQDRTSYRFRLRGRNSTGTGDWTYIDAITRVYPHPWLSYDNIGSSVLDADPGPWPRPNNILNLGGGTFNWTTTSNQTWLTASSSGAGEGPLGTLVYKPGGIREEPYSGRITVHAADPTPVQFCNANQSSTSVTLYFDVKIRVVDHFEYYYLPIILKHSQ